ncbi:MAG: hypothetical protein DWP98_06765 [Bacteroidetes bacterium]|nr:MAG: hypothetical protein DWP98_06765 [Bacteroidota bacterium]MBL1145623.1 hypothetical protein [Bacteroidota bacterium]
MHKNSLFKLGFKIFSFFLFLIHRFIRVERGERKVERRKRKTKEENEKKVSFVNQSPSLLRYIAFHSQ